MNISFLSLDHDFTPCVWLEFPPTLVKLRPPNKIHRQTPTVFGKISGLRQRLQEWCRRTAFQGVFFFGGGFWHWGKPNSGTNGWCFLHRRTRVRFAVLALEMISGHLIIIRLLSEYSIISDYLLVLVDIYIFWYILTYHMTFYLFETNLFHSQVSKARRQSWHGQFIYLWSQRSNLICCHLPWKSSWKWWVW